MMKTSPDNRFLDNSIFIDEPPTAPKAVVLMLHGLNLRPAKMDGWAHALSKRGALVMRVALYGHSADKTHMKIAHPDRWRQQFSELMDMAQQQSLAHQIPIYFVGFSLGALVGLEWLSNHEQALIKKMVLIAPAIAIPWYSQAAVGFLSVFGTKLTLPSRSPKDYRANSGTSVAAYQALFALKNALEQRQFKNTNKDTIVLIDKYDELVPSSDIKNIINQYRLSLWKLDIVDNRFAHKNYGFRHLMVDENAVGPELWAEIKYKVIKHLEL